MEAKPFSIPSFAKINWFLKVGNRREDGFHEICTALQTVSLADILTFGPSDRFELTCSDPELPNGPENLIVRAAEMLRERTGVDRGANVFLDKRIPFPGGLGGGSSNAAAALLGLSVLWNVEPTRTELIEMASELGSDVPFFLFGGTALGTGRGTEIKPLPDIGGKSLLLASPGVRIPTGPAFEMLAKRGLTKDSPDFILNVCRDLAEKLFSDRPELVNDFESAVLELAPEVARVHSALAGSGASEVLLSGSGASVFGIFDNDSLRNEAISILVRRENIRVFAAETVSRAGYEKALGPCRHLLQKITG